MKWKDAQGRIQQTEEAQDQMRSSASSTFLRNWGMQKAAKEHRTITPILKTANSFSKRDYASRIKLVWTKKNLAKTHFSKTAFPKSTFAKQFFQNNFLKHTSVILHKNETHVNPGTENNSPKTILHIIKASKNDSQMRLLQTRF